MLYTQIWILWYDKFQVGLLSEKQNPWNITTQYFTDKDLYNRIMVRSNTNTKANGTSCQLNWALQDTISYSLCFFLLNGNNITIYNIFYISELHLTIQFYSLIFNNRYIQGSRLAYTQHPGPSWIALQATYLLTLYPHSVWSKYMRAIENQWLSVFFHHLWNGIFEHLLCYWL